jgi:hypothetical protein
LNASMLDERPMNAAMVRPVAAPIAVQLRSRWRRLPESPSPQNSDGSRRTGAQAAAELVLNRPAKRSNH